MTNQSVNPPAGWVRTGRSERAPGDSFRYDLSESERVLVGLTAASADDTDERRLRASTVEERGGGRRHDFVVAAYDGRSAARAGAESFMAFVTDALSDARPDRRLCATVQEAVGEFRTEGGKSRSSLARWTDRGGAMLP